MKSSPYSNYLQWLPKEILEDTINRAIHSLFNRQQIQDFCQLFHLLVKYGVVDVNGKIDGVTPLRKALNKHHSAASNHQVSESR